MTDPALPLTARQARHRSAALALTTLRLALGPAFIVLGWQRWSSTVAGAMLAVAFVSDYFDGVIARRGDVATAGLRRYDSISDTVCYLGAAFAVWRLYPDVIRQHLLGVGLVLGTQVLCHVIEVARFGREASYHAWTAKLWGLMLASALFLLFATGSDRLLTAAIACGLLSHAENIAITFVLPEWRHDVPSVVHALRLRSTTSPPRSDRSQETNMRS